jgi:dimethylglycine catabolism A
VSAAEPRRAPAFDPSRYPALFSPLVLPCGARLKNRVTHASMTTRMGRDQGVTEQQIRYYANRAKGGCALIVTEPLNSWREQKNPYKARVWNDDHLDTLKRWADAVESEDCRLLGQIQDPGRGRHERGRNPIAVGVSSLHDGSSAAGSRASRSRPGTGTCSTSSCPRGRTSATTSTAGRSRTGCASCAT